MINEFCFRGRMHAAVGGLPDPASDAIRYATPRSWGTSVVAEAVTTTSSLIAMAAQDPDVGLGVATTKADRDDVVTLEPVTRRTRRATP